MSGIQSELGPKGFQAVGAAINDNPNVPGFIQQFKPPFPIGIADNMDARNYLGIGIGEQAYVPLMVLIDRAGSIRFQHTGGDQKFFNDDLVIQATNLRGEIDKLLAEGQKAATPAAHKSTTTGHKRTGTK